MYSLEEHAQRARADAAEKYKAQLENFIDMICHEIRNPYYSPPLLPHMCVLCVACCAGVQCVVCGVRCAVCSVRVRCAMCCVLFVIFIIALLHYVYYVFCVMCFVCVCVLCTVSKEIRINVTFLLNAG